MQNGSKHMFFMKEKSLKEIEYKYFMKISGIMSKFLTDTLAKMTQNIFAIFPF